MLASKGCPISGHVYRHDGRRGSVWRAKYRLPDGRQVHRTIGPVWTQRGRPAAGFFTKRGAEAWLRGVLQQAEAGTLPGLVQTGVSVAEATQEFLRHVENDRRRKPSTLIGYRSVIRAHILPAFGSLAIEDLEQSMIERWIATVEGSPRTRTKVLAMLHSILERARRTYRLPTNPAADVEKFPSRSTGDIEVFSPEEVMALVGAAASDQDAAIYLTAAFTGLRRGELVALRWRDVDFQGSVIRVRASFSDGGITSPKSGKVRSVPMARQVAKALERMKGRERWTDATDLVFVGATGSYLDGSALSRRFRVALKASALRPLRFHDLRHTFGTRMIGEVDIRRVQEWMGHADIQTTMRYLHYVPRQADAELVGAAFAVASTAS